MPNRSSIVLLVEHRGASVLLMADSVPRIVQPAIRKLTERRGSEAPLHVDVVKLSHHGSRRNTSAKFLDSVRARHYLVSTDGSRHGLPNDEALARVIRNAGTLWFNHDNAVTRRWDADTSPWAGHAYQTQYPTSPTTGAVIHLAGSES